MRKSVSCKDQVDLPRMPARSRVAANTLAMPVSVEILDQTFPCRKLDIALPSSEFVISYSRYYNICKLASLGKERK